MSHFERTGRQCITGSDRHDTRFATRYRNQYGYQFGMGKPDRHGSYESICID
jgi:hypothetical protein